MNGFEQYLEKRLGMAIHFIRVRGSHVLSLTNVQASTTRQFSSQ